MRRSASSIMQSTSSSRGAKRCISYSYASARRFVHPSCNLQHQTHSALCNVDSRGDWTSCSRNNASIQLDHAKMRFRWSSVHNKSVRHLLPPIQLRSISLLDNKLCVVSNSRCYSSSSIQFKEADPKSSYRSLHDVDSTDDSIQHRKHEPAASSPVPNKVPNLPNEDSTKSKPSEPSIHNISYLPSSLHPYAHLSRLDKPIGTYLLLHPCLWSTSLAAYPLGSIPDLSLCALFATGAFVMRGAGCTINDMWDAKFDREVERTKSRPLASGILSYKQATAWLGLQLSVGLGVLLSLPNVETCFWWGVASLPLVGVYPLMKRFTNYPQLVLGLTFNWGAIMGWVAVRGSVDWSVVGPLYLSGVCWTLVYDTLYAHQDKVDDRKLGLKSTALTFGEDTKPILTSLAVATWLGWMTAGYNVGYGVPWEAPYYYLGCSLAAAHLLWQVQSSDLNNPENLAYMFRSNNLVGWTMFASCAVGNIMAC